MAETFVQTQTFEFLPVGHQKQLIYKADTLDEGRYHKPVSLRGPEDKNRND